MVRPAFPVMAHPTAAGKTPPRLQHQRGFGYVLVLMLVLMLLYSLGIISERIETVAQREREAELIFIGNQYRNAIKSYYENTPGGLKAYPMQLEDLLLDKRSLGSVKHIRKLYADPMQTEIEWGLVKNEARQITGVFSQSTAIAFSRSDSAGYKVDQNAAPNSDLRYMDWKFVYVPEKASEKAPAPGQAAEGAEDDDSDEDATAESAE